VPIRICNAGGGGGHFMMISDVRGEGANKKYLISDPWTGKTAWVKQSELQNFNSNWPQTYFSKDLATASATFTTSSSRCNRASWWVWWSRSWRRQRCKPSLFSPLFYAAVAHSRVMNDGYISDATQALCRAAPAQAGADRPPSRRAGETAGHHGRRRRGVAAAAATGRHVSDRPPRRGQRPIAGQLAMHRAGMCLVHGRLAEAADAAKVAPTAPPHCCA